MIKIDQHFTLTVGRTVTNVVRTFDPTHLLVFFQAIKYVKSH